MLIYLNTFYVYSFLGQKLINFLTNKQNQNRVKPIKELLEEMSETKRSSRRKQGESLDEI